MDVLKRIALRYEVPAASMRRRRKWVVLGVVAMGGVAASTLTGGEGGAFHGFGAALADPLSVFAARSPGERVDGALTQTKAVLPGERRRGGGPPPPAVPRERVLSEVRTRPPIPFDGVSAPFAFAPNDLPTGFGPVGDGNDFPIPPAGPGGFADNGGGGGGGGGTEPNPPVSAVPEPATWASMILGFLTVAGMIRRGARRTGSRRWAGGAAAPRHRMSRDRMRSRRRG